MVISKLWLCDIYCIDIWPMSPRICPGIFNIQCQKLTSYDCFYVGLKMNMNITACLTASALEILILV